MKNKRIKRSHGMLWGLIISVLCAAVVFANWFVMYNSANSKTDELGKAQLAQVSGELQKTLDESKQMLLKFASDVEAFRTKGASRAEMLSYLKSQSRIFKDQSGGIFTNAYICTADWILISDSAVPENYVITERGWYSETMKCGAGKIYTTAPYLDAFTDGMVFTTALLLPDGETMVGIDFTPQPIRSTIADMSSGGGNGEALIVSRNGTIVGYTDDSFAGKKIDALPEYVDIYSRLLNESGDSIMFEAEINGVKSKIFSDRSGEWLLIYKAGPDTVFGKAYIWVWVCLLLGLLLLAGMIVFLIMAGRSRAKAEEALRNKESFLDNLSVRIREPLNTILKTSAASEGGSRAAEQMRAVQSSAVTLSEMLDNLFSYKNVKTELENELYKKDRSRPRTAFALTKGARNGIMAILLTAVTVAVVFTGIALVGWGRDRMAREVDTYNYQLEKWSNTQLQTLNMFVDTISANPSVLDDYDFAVQYLDNIVKNYSEISAAYIARPGTEHEMTMNNGWVPNSDYIITDRQWYKDTLNSATGINISTPYLDARTGLYCMTFSRVVYDARKGDRIGVFALDFYTENLTTIMESSYSGSGYAFLVDRNNIIVNHPNIDYRITNDKSTSIEGTEYNSVLSSGLHIFRDYDGKLKVGISRKEDFTGFTLVSVRSFYSVYGFVLLCGIVFIALLVACIVLLYKLIMRMIKWQDEVRRTLTEEADRAARADRAKSSFLAQMSHEIRTPINAVLGMNEMILRESKEEQILDYASNAYNAGNALLSIINDILDLSKIEAGKFQIVESEYELYSLIGDCYNMTVDRAAKKGLAMDCTVDERLPRMLSGDMFHIRQIIVNLITNAIKYTDEGSVSLLFSGASTKVGFALKVSVKDTGIGLTEESREKLFDSFQRFDLKRNQSVEGTGLGLSICKQLANLMGGEIVVESVYGKGSTFTCIIPQDIVDRAPIGKISLDRHSTRLALSADARFTAESARILVVDDVDMNITVFKSLVKNHKMQIDEARSGKQCLEMIAKQKYDIIFMDHMMPEMDGIETYEHMKESDHPNKDTPVIMLTANAISGEKEKYMEEGFASYLTKPIQSDKLSEALLKFLPDEKIVRQEEAEKEAENTREAEDAKEAQPAPEAPESVLIDEKLGLTYAGDSLDTYLDILESFLKNDDEKREKLTEMVSGEDWKNYTISVHALKSASLTIGARGLSSAAEALEKAGKTEEYGIIREKHPALTELYDKVIARAEEILAEHGRTLSAPEPEKARPLSELREITKQELFEYIERIKAACAAFDDDEIASVCGELSECSCGGKALAEAFAPVAGAAGDFDFKKAETLAEQILNEQE